MAQNPSASTVMLATLAGGLAARTVDEWLPDVSYKFSAMGRDFTIRPTAAVGLVVLGAALAGIDIPAEGVVVPMAAGALAFETTFEVGDDLAALVLGRELPGAPVPPTPPVLPPATTSPLMYQQSYQPVDNWTLRQAVAGMRGF